MIHWIWILETLGPLICWVDFDPSPNRAIYRWVSFEGRDNHTSFMAARLSRKRNFYFGRESPTHVWKNVTGNSWAVMLYWYLELKGERKQLLKPEGTWHRFLEDSYKYSIRLKKKCGLDKCVKKNKKKVRTTSSCHLAVCSFLRWSMQWWWDPHNSG